MSNQFQWFLLNLDLPFLGKLVIDLVLILDCIEEGFSLNLLLGCVGKHIVLDFSEVLTFLLLGDSSEDAYLRY